MSAIGREQRMARVNAVVLKSARGWSMFDFKRARSMSLAALGAAVFFASCFAEPNGVQGTGGSSSSTGGSTFGDGAAPPEAGTANACISRPAVEGAECRPVIAAEPLHVKAVKDEPQDTLVFVDDLFVQFKAHCGSCHVDTNLGEFQAKPLSFAKDVGWDALNAIKSDVEECAEGDDTCLPFMPPRESNGKPWSERAQDGTDPVVLFANQLEEWLKQAPEGELPPSDAFILPAEKGGKSLYAIDEDFAKTFTNIGTCIPDAGMVGTEPSNACDLDARFAEMQRDPGSPSLADRIGLPLTLDQTDLFTLDSAELAPYGVVAYAPAYPLWTDDAGKLRHIRVPRGESVSYDKASKSFNIPENTRFYKTFLKRVKVGPDEYRYRKIETRLIVSRKNGQSLFGTYEWNDEETNATLVTSPLRSGEPFTDVLKTIIVDEPLAAEIQRQKDAGEIRNLTYELDRQHAVRRYAIPGSERCIQCHMGNPDFVLGFSPIQVNRRPCERETIEEEGFCEGGILDPAAEDDVSQLQRLIDYGIITGYDEPEPLKLEDPQGGRNYRTPEELVAQGYLLGNCAHCHNPIGYPSMLNPELKSALDFLPSEEGGIYDFPLERTSPRIKRGALGEISLPYITPSLYDIQMVPPATAATIKWTPKYSAEPGGSFNFYEAPWRSVIYRNVDTPFTYADHYAIYPHMPINSPGFDCRAPRIIGDWMVSIPALRKRPDLSETAYLEASPLGPNKNGAEIDPQPYREVEPDDPKYELAVIQAQARLDQYRAGDRYANYCPETTDIVDLDVVRGKYLTPQDLGFQSPVGLPKDGVPDRSHWVVTDLTDAPGEWSPRRTDWQEVIVNGNVPPHGYLPGQGAYPEAEAARNAQIQLVGMLQDISITDAFRQFAEEKFPLGLWQVKKDCADALAKQPKLGDYQGAERLRWMDVVAADPSSAVFESSPGEAVYRMICINCHGSEADSMGRQATTLQDMTGGTGRVANLRDGLFGPAGSNGANRDRVFGSEVLASRYLAWMALGGTLTRIPQAILDLVANTEVLGKGRSGNVGVVSSANMLQVAQNLCYGIATAGTYRGGGAITPKNLAEQLGWSDLHFSTGLIVQNGDAELWHRLCSWDNPAPVRKLVATASAGTAGGVITLNKGDLYWPAEYPPGEKIGNHFGRIASALTSDNLFPWCVETPADPDAAAWLATQRTADNQPLPLCPPAFLSPDNQFVSEFDAGTSTFKYPDLDKWATRGAVNAGLAVFVYLDKLVGDDVPSSPRFNECELLE